MIDKEFHLKNEIAKLKAALELSEKNALIMAEKLTEKNSKEAHTATQAGKGVFIQRCKDIMNLPEAAKRKDAAFSIMTDTELTPEQAAKMLKMMPEDKQYSHSPSNQFAEHMARLGNPNIGPSYDDDESADKTAEKLMTHIAKNGA